MDQGDSGSGIVLRDLAIGDAGWIISRHACLYAREEGYDATFEALVAEILAAYIRSHDPDRERAWIAWRAGARIGSIFCVRQDEDTAKLRLFLVEPAARGTGLGKRLLRECLAFARATGYRRMVLWTHASHRAACALYAAHGFRLTSETPAVDFGQAVIDQTWEIDLT
ncbi:MAG: GNAT family N-acetyltransferase [Paracoccaceae bacterium]|nr:GNAT family N-acetyltransferase [Paracoccaceae bacterium]